MIEIPKLPVGSTFETSINWMTDNLDAFFEGVSGVIMSVLSAFESVLMWPHPLVIIAIMVGLAWYVAKEGVAIFSLLGLLLIYNMQYF